MSTRETQVQHTPGPWAFATSDPDYPEIYETTSGGDYLVATVEREFDSHRGRGRVVADGHLIAAAPDLLSLARRFVALPSGAWHPQRHAAEEMELVAEARAIIARATHTEAGHGR